MAQVNGCKSVTPQPRLPPNWEMFRDSLGREFYWNHHTKESVWQPPVVVSPDQGSDALPPGWEAKTTREGKVYYVDHASRTTSWVRPQFTKQTSPVVSPHSVRHQTSAPALSASNVIRQGVPPHGFSGPLRSAPVSTGTSSAKGSSTSSTSTSSSIGGGDNASKRGRGNHGSSMLGGSSGLKKAAMSLLQPSSQGTVGVTFENAPTCHVCKLKFNLFQRAHHCRSCGRSCCHACSSRRVVLPRNKVKTPVRVCGMCYSMRRDDDMRALVSAAKDIGFEEPRIKAALLSAKTSGKPLKGMTVSQLVDIIFSLESESNGGVSATKENGGDRGTGATQRADDAHDDDDADADVDADSDGKNSSEDQRRDDEDSNDDDNDNDDDQNILSHALRSSNPLQIGTSGGQVGADAVASSADTSRLCVEAEPVLSTSLPTASALTQIIEEQSTTAENSGTSPLESEGPQAPPDADICKICFEAPYDCVILECGHMCCCLECSKTFRTQECPFCRQPIVRIVRVFKV